MELIRYKKAYFDFEILETYEAGLVLRGYEVKAIRHKNINLKGGYILFKHGEAWVENIDIGAYQAKNQPPEDTHHPRKLLLKKAEIAKLLAHSESPGLTVVPLRILLKNNRIKLEIGLCRGKKKYDKRDTIKKRDLDREIRK